MQETKTITLQELSTILRQYKHMDVGTFSDDGNCCLTASFSVDKMKYGTKGNGVPYLRVFDDYAFWSLSGNTVKIIYDAWQGATYFAFIVVANSLHYNVTLYK